MTQLINRCGMLAGPAALFLLLFAMFVAPLTSGELLAGHDVLAQFYHQRHLTYELLRSGELPLWNPYIFCGMPLLAEIQTAAFYPLNFPFLFLSTAPAINLSFATHVFMAGLFTWFFARSMGIGRAGALLAATAYMFGGFAMGYVFSGHLPQLIALSWTPLLFFAAQKGLKKGGAFSRYIILGAIVLALQLLGGHPQIVYGSLVGVTVFVLFYWPHGMASFARGIGRRAWLLIFVTAFGFVLAAVELIPAAEFSSLSDRAIIKNFRFATEDSFPPEKFITLAAPEFFGNKTNSIYWGRSSFWETTGFVGIAVLAFVPAAFTMSSGAGVTALGAVFLAGTLLALGRYTPVYGWLFPVLPFLDQFRNPSRFFVVSILAFSVMGGIGLDALMRQGATDARRRYCVFLAAVAVCLTAATAGFYVTGKNSILWRRLVALSVYGYENMPDEMSSFMFANSVSSLAYSSVAAAIVCISACVGKGSLTRIRAAKAVILGVAFFHLFHFGKPLIRTADSSLYTLPDGLVRYLRNNLKGQRVALAARVFTHHSADRTMTHEIPNALGYEGQMLADCATFLCAAAADENRPETISHTQLISDFDRPMVRLLSAKYAVRTPGEARLPSGRYQPLFRDGEYVVYGIPGLPRVFLVNDVVVSHNASLTLELLDSSEFDPQTRAILGGFPAHSLDGGNRLEGSAEIVTDTPRLVEVETSSPIPSVLIVLDAYYPGWKAYVDGVETGIIRANYMFRAVSLPAGNHRIAFKYRPRSFMVGAGLSIIGVLALVVIGVIHISRPNGSGSGVKDQSRSSESLPAV